MRKRKGLLAGFLCAILFVISIIPTGLEVSASDLEHAENIEGVTVESTDAFGSELVEEDMDIEDQPAEGISDKDSDEDKEEDKIPSLPEISEEESTDIITEVPEDTSSEIIIPEKDPDESLPNLLENEDEVVKTSPEQNDIIFKDFVVESGEAGIYARAVVEYPDNMNIVRKGFELTGENIEGVKTYEADWYSDELVGELRTTFELIMDFTVDDKSGDVIMVKPFVVTVDSDGVEKTIYGVTKNVSVKSTDELECKFEIEAETSSISVQYDIQILGDNMDLSIPGPSNPWYFSYKYKKEGADSYKEGRESITKLSGAIAIPDPREFLEENTTYELQLILKSSYQVDSRILYEYTTSFTTKGIVTYTDKDFPDETLRAYIQKQVGEGNPLTSDRLEKIRQISFPAYESNFASIGTDKAIKDLTGIEYLTNLSLLHLDGHDIEDITPITKIKGLSDVSFTYNNISVRPDLSEMKCLRRISLDGNKIPMSESSRGEAQLLVSDTYIVTNDSIVFYMEISNTRDRYREWEVTININGNEYAVPMYRNLNGRYTTELIDIPVGIYPMVISAQENYGGQLLELKKDVSIKYPEPSTSVTRFLYPDSDRVPIDVYIPLINYDEKFVEAKLVDSAQNDCVVGVEKANGSTSINSVIYRVPVSESGGITNWPTDILEPNSWHVDGTIHLNENNLAGSFDLIVTTNEAEYRIHDYAVSDYQNACITKIQTNYNYDNWGKYYYLKVEGEGLKYNEFYPVLTLKDGTAITKLDSRIGNTYKLEKLSGFQEGYFANVQYISEPGCPEVKSIPDVEELYINANNGLYIDKVIYNEKAEEYWLYVTPDMVEGTELFIGLSSEYPYDEATWEYITTAELATAEVVVHSGKNIVNFRDKEGNIYKPSRTGTVFYYAKWEGNDTIGVISGQCPWQPVKESVRFQYSTGKGYCSCSSKFMQDYSIDIVDENGMIIASFPVSGNGNYAFTSKDLQNVLAIDPDLKGLYSLIASKDGYVYGEIHNVNIGYVGKEEPEIVPNRIKLSKTTAFVREEETLQLTATISPANATNKKITWSSDNEEVAITDQTGKVTALKEGKAVIQAVTSNGKSAVCTVIVYNSEGNEYTLMPSETIQLQIPEGISTKNAKYTSENTSVASVSAKGLVKALGIGRTTVTLKSGNVEIVYLIIVSNPLQSISFEEMKIEMEPGEVETNRIIFKPAYTDSDKLLTVLVGDEKIAATTVTGKTVRIEAIAEGTTTITVKAGQLETSCTVTVQKPLEIPDIKKNEVYAFTNRDWTLADLNAQLPAGFTFMNPEITLAQFAGVNEKEFAVVHTGTDGRKGQTVQNVKFITIEGIEAILDTASIEARGETEALLMIRFLWKGSNVSDVVKEKILKDYSVEISPSKNGIVTLTERKSSENESSAAGFFTVTGNLKGKVKLNITLRKKGTQGKEGILCNTNTEITVVENKADMVIEVSGAEYDKEGDFYYVKDITSVNISLKALAEGYKVIWSSSDTGVAGVGKAVDNTAKVTLKSNGKVKFTATANDAGKTTKSIMLYVMDMKPAVDPSVTINKAMEEGGTLGIYANYGYSIDQYDVRVVKKEDRDRSDGRFAIDFDSLKNTYEISIADGASVPEGKYSVTVSVTAATDVGKQEYFTDLLINVINKPVTWSVKQSKKVNLFYTDEEGNGNLNVNGKNAVLESVELSDCDFVYDPVTGSIVFQGANYRNADKDGNLTVKFEGYKEVSRNISIKTEVRKPSIVVSSASSVLYPAVDITKASIKLTNKTTGSTLRVQDGNINQIDSETNSYRAFAEEGNICFELKDGLVSYPKSEKVTLAVQMNNWNEEIKIGHTLKCNNSKNPALKLSSSTLTLNRNAALARYQEGAVEVKIKDATENTAISNVTVGGADIKSLDAMLDGLDFAYEADTGILSVSFNDSREITTGSYKFNVNTEVAGGKNIKTNLKVVVVDKAPSASVTVSTKGSIDILDRANSSMICTPKMNGVSGDIVGVRLTGRDAHLFTAEMNTQGKTIIKARQNAAYITKYAYKLQLAYTLKSGNREYTVISKPLSIKVKQASVKLNTNLASTYLYQGAENSLNLNVSAVNVKGGKLKVGDVEIVETKIMKGVFDVSYSETAGCYQLSLKDSSKVKKGKTYSVKLNVRLAEQADNEKNKIVTVKVTIR